MTAPPLDALVAAPAQGVALPEVGLLAMQILVVLGAARLVGWAMGLIGQPRVVGEMAAGIVLGPSVLGALAPGASASLFPPASLGFLSALSQVGLLLFMFLVGLELDPKTLRAHGRAALVTSASSIVAPFALGVLLARGSYPAYVPEGVPFYQFALFLGAAMSVTAFPVLARILAERGLLRTPLGTMAIVCAALNDVAAWCILAAIVALVRASGTGLPLWLTIGGSGLYVALVLGPGRMLLARIAADVRRKGGLTRDALAMTMLAVLASAWATELLGVHALFGAFLVGAAMPKDEGLVRAILDRLEDAMVVIFLPLFFAFTGLRTRVSLIDGAAAWALCGLLIAVAVAGKLGGTAVAARASGMGWRDATALGVLMNTRGLMELVILNVGLDIGVISPILFAMMVLMALATTLMTTPLLAALGVRGEEARA